MEPCSRDCPRGFSTLRHSLCRHLCRHRSSPPSAAPAFPQLWNLRSSKRVHEFEHGWRAAVTAFEQSPALDVVGVGLADGLLLLHRLGARHHPPLRNGPRDVSRPPAPPQPQVRHDSPRAAPHARRRGAPPPPRPPPRPPPLARRPLAHPRSSHSPTGALPRLPDRRPAVARLRRRLGRAPRLAPRAARDCPLERTEGEPSHEGAPEGRVQYTPRRRARLSLEPCAHEGGVASCHFLRGRPELLTAGAADNSLRMWSSDLHSGELSALRGRAGHAAPPTLVRFHDDELHVGGGPGGRTHLPVSPSSTRR